MESLFSSIIPYLQRSERILLVTHRKPDGDAIGSIMALSKALSLLGKEVTAACQDELPEAFKSLPQVQELARDIPGGKEFVVTLDCDKTEVDRLKYHLEDNKIHIVITPKKGRFEQKNVSFSERRDHFDLIIAVDVADIPQLGKLYEENVDLFTSLPIMNIDHHASNTNFGIVNAIDVSACSTAEILYRLIQDLEQHLNAALITPEVATYLLSGVTTDTGSFQNANTTPRSLQIASELIDLGAKHQDIIKYLFRTKKLTTLKLWGRILTKIEVDGTHRLVWSTITGQDLKQAGAVMDESGDIIDELLVHAPEADIVLLFKEEKNMTSVSLRSKSSEVSVMDIAAHFGGGGHVAAAGIKFPGKTLAEVMSLVLSEAQRRQAKRLNVEEVVKETEVTQVLEGYTKMPEPASVRPTLEEKVTGKPIPLPPVAQPPAVPSPTAVPPKASEILKPQAPEDIHHKAKAAIEAEHRDPGNDNGFSPSKAQTQERPKPPAPQRFTNDVPEFLKRAPAPEAPKPEAKKDEGITISPAPAGSKPPEIPAGSSAPVVTLGGMTGTKPPAPPTPPSPPTPPTPPTPPSAPVPPSPPAKTPEPPKAPPKDPFAIGDDGMTDIERALGIL